MPAVNLENQSANWWAYPHVEVLVVECMLCPSSERLQLPHSTPDDMARRIFEWMGWTVQPTRCPQHVGQPLPKEA